ncbi:putative 40S ribosomal protein [Naja naja]|nr:putative 40S ribosomal protein [Naja naja]
MAVVKLACSSILANVVYGLLVALLVVGADLLFITFSYCMITRAVLALPSRDARYKAFSTCAAHVVVILVSYTPALFTILTHRFGHHVLPHVHILLANFYLLFPPMLNPIVYGVKTQEIRDQTERAYQKQPTIFQNKKRVLLGDAGKEKLPRYYKNIGLGFKTPKEAIEGSYIDKKCPFTGNVSIRGRILSGVVTKMKMQRTIVIRRDYLHYIRKYNRQKHTEHVGAPVSLLQGCADWGYRDSGRVPPPQQDCPVQRPQGDQGCWHQKTVPEVLKAICTFLCINKEAGVI